MASRPLNHCRLVWPGWYCIRKIEHDGPCALIPRWWNIPGRIMERKGMARW